MRWKIFYDDGSTYAHGRDPYDAPANGVIVIVQEDPRVGRILISESHFYCWNASHREWFGAGRTDVISAGLWDYLSQPGPKKVIFGRTLPTIPYNAIIKLAVNDPDFPPKSANHPIERF